MTGRDRDTVRKAAARHAKHYDVTALEDVRSRPMSTSARARGRPGVEAKRALNRKIRNALWGFTQRAVASAVETAGGLFVQIIAADSSRTCPQCGHVDARSRNAKHFECTWCGHGDDADVNAAKVIRARAARWLCLRDALGSDARAQRAARGGL